MLEGGGAATTEVDARDADALRRRIPEIVDVVRRLLDAVAAGELGRAPDDAGPGMVSARIGWL